MGKPRLCRRSDVVGIMKKKFYAPYIIFAVAIFFVLSIPGNTVGKGRSAVSEVVVPIWSVCHNIKLIASRPFQWMFGSGKKAVLRFEEENQRLQLENQQLHEELERFQRILQHEQFIEYQISRLESMNSGMVPKVEKHYDELGRLLGYQLQALPASVVSRDPSSWGSSLWLNVGEADNDRMGRFVVMKDSPVVLGTSLVGVVDYVGTHQCRVRLITDAGLNPSVRAMRGYPQAMLVGEQIYTLLQILTSRLTDLHPHGGKDDLVYALEVWQESLLNNKGHSWYLAKGYLQGSSMPLWRSGGSVLKGVGFNYDFSDEEGEAKDLRTGKRISALTDIDEPVEPIIKVNDVLVTTGMDGIFPPGLRVATVSKIDPLKEGGYFYGLEAVPTAGSFADLSLLYVLPPIVKNHHKV